MEAQALNEVKDPKEAQQAKEFYLSKPWLKHYPPQVPQEVEVPVVTIHSMFEESALRFPDKTAIIFYGRKLSYKALKDQIDRCATALDDIGLKKGQRMAFYLLNCPQFIIAYFAALKLGATVTVINPVYTSTEVEHQLSDSGASVLICQDILYENVERSGVKPDKVILTGIEEYLPSVSKLLGKSVMRQQFLARNKPSEALFAQQGIYRFKDLIQNYPPNPPVVQINPQEDIAVLSYTGGTTAKSKGVMLTHYCLVANDRQMRSAWHELEDGKEIALAFMPFAHVYGQLAVMLLNLSHGSTIVLFTAPDHDKILYAIEKFHTSTFFGVPTLFEFLREYEKTDRVNWKRLKIILGGADTLHEETAKGWKKKTGTEIREGYGLTESIICTFTPAGKSREGSCGVPVPNVCAAIVDPNTNEFVPPGVIGEIIVSGPGVMKGYWQLPEETAEMFVEIDGRKWLKTGDLMRADDDGFFYFYDRMKDLIKVRGMSVFAREIEEVLYNHPQVKAAGVIGIPDAKIGNLIKANIVLQAEARGKISEDEIIEYCKERLSFYKVPHIVDFRGELPKTDMGKISRRELRDEEEVS